jgi:hypothetical protein
MSAARVQTVRAGCRSAPSAGLARAPGGRHRRGAQPHSGLIALCGPKERIRDRLAAYRAAGVTTLVCMTGEAEALRLMAELVL